ncbi:MAG TPA: CcmD family protein, partial [Chitinophagaceae bacterium]|nr:CcmD family protein [Chitinophagaceae bacterium]
MKKIVLKIFFLLLLVLPSLLLHAQDKPVEMADTMRSNGRIYVVIAVMLIILAGLILYLVRLDRKLKKI